MKIGVAKETAPGERRVALVPEVLGKLKAAGLEILVERGAGAGSSIPDAAYQEAGATIVSTGELYAGADAILRVAKPSDAEVASLRSGQALLGLLSPLVDPKLAKAIADRGVTAISLDAIPRTLSRAQTMDALSSQANVGGYKAVLVAANTYGRYFPLLTTAAGTAKPANVLILGIGVAGLQAIGTARRLGAVVNAYDVRPETREQAESLGAKFVKLKTTIDATGAGGYARELTAEERASQQAELNEVIGAMDIVITTAQVPGRKPPLLVTAEAVGLMKSGSVIVDMAVEQAVDLRQIEARHHEHAAARGEFVAQDPTQQLARLVKRKLVAERNAFGRVRRAQHGPHVLPQFVFGAVPASHNGGHHALAPLEVGNANDRRLGDRRVLEQHVLNLAGRQVLATPHDHVVDAALHEQVTVGVEIAGVAGVEPAVGQAALDPLVFARHLVAAHPDDPLANLYFNAG